MQPDGEHTNLGRPTSAHIDLDALSHNLTEVRRLCGGRSVLAVVKANAYGHGAVDVSRRLEAEGAEMLGVALVEEGAELRAAGIKVPILVMGGVMGHQAEDLLTHGLTPVVFARAQADSFSKAAAARGARMPVHVKVDTGMGRVGMPPDEAAAFIRHIAGLPGLELEGIMTHLSDVSGPDKEFAAYQVGAFRKVLSELAAEGITFPMVHAAGSAAVIEFGEALFSLVRPGIMLYGCYPSILMKGLASLRPVMSVRTRVMHVKTMDAGMPVSYNRTFYTARPSVIATLPIGYADGFNRGLSNRGRVLVRGRSCPVVGTVCMDLTMVEVTDAPGVTVGDEAVIIGRQGDAEVTADEIAGLLGTINYEVLCNISKRVPRVYHG